MPQVGCRDVPKTPTCEPSSLILSVRAWSPLTFMLLSIYKLLKQNSCSSSRLNWKHLQSTRPHPVITSFSSSQPILPTLLPTQFLSLLPPTLPIQSSYLQTSSHLGPSGSMSSFFAFTCKYFKTAFHTVFKMMAPSCTLSYGLPVPVAAFLLALKITFLSCLNLLFLGHFKILVAGYKY